MKRLILGKGQVFGEEACLANIYSKGEDVLPTNSIYNVSCSSFEGEILYARADDVYKLFKLEADVVRFLVQQFTQKCPDEQLPDNLLLQAFSHAQVGKPISERPALKTASGIR